jgi:hypothetical protein
MGRCESNEVQRRRLCGRSSSGCCWRSAHVHARYADRFARQASHHGGSQSLRVGPDGVATGRQLWRRGSGRARSHEALLEQPEHCPAELTRRSATLTLATPAVSHTERPATMAAGRPESAETGWQRGGRSDASVEPRQRVHEGATARRSHERCSGALPWLSSPTI